MRLGARRYPRDDTPRYSRSIAACASLRSLFPQLLLEIGELRLDGALASLPVGIGLRARVLVRPRGAGRFQVPPRRGDRLRGLARRRPLGLRASSRRARARPARARPAAPGSSARARRPARDGGPRSARRWPPSRDRGPPRPAGPAAPRPRAASAPRRARARSPRARRAWLPTPSLPSSSASRRPGGVGSRVAPRAVAQQLLQSRLQTVEHGRTRPGIDDSSGNGPAAKRRGPAAGRRPKQLGNRMVGPPPETVKRAGLPALPGTGVAYHRRPTSERSSMSSESCSVCAEVAGRITAPGGVVYRNEWWEVAHHTGPQTDPGELIVKLRRHAESLAELTPAESAALGPVLRCRRRRGRARRAARAGLRRLVWRARAPRALLPPAPHDQPPGRAT